MVGRTASMAPAVTGCFSLANLRLSSSVSQQSRCHRWQTDCSAASGDGGETERTGATEGLLCDRGRVRTVVVILVLESRYSQIFLSSSCDNWKIGQCGPRLMSARAFRAASALPPFSRLDRRGPRGLGPGSILGFDCLSSGLWSSPPCASSLSASSALSRLLRLRCLGGMSQV